MSEDPLKKVTRKGFGILEYCGIVESQKNVSNVTLDVQGRVKVDDNGVDGSLTRSNLCLCKKTLTRKKPLKTQKV